MTSITQKWHEIEEKTNELQQLLNEKPIIFYPPISLFLNRCQAPKCGDIVDRGKFCDVACQHEKKLSNN